MSVVKQMFGRLTEIVVIVEKQNNTLFQKSKYGMSSIYKLHTRSRDTFVKTIKKNNHMNQVVL